MAFRVSLLTRKILWREVSGISRQCKRPMSVQLKTQSSDRGYGLLIIPFTTFCLGTWQVKRRQWKLDLISQLEKKTLTPPIPFPENYEDLQDLEYRKVVIKGKFDHSKEIFIGPRSLFEPEKEEMRRGLSSTAKSGVQVITPFKIDNTNDVILVNRGWIPRQYINPSTRVDGQVKDTTEITGVVRHTEKRPPFGPANDVARNQWYTRNLEEMSQVLDTLPILIDADANSTIPGGPIGGQTRVTLRNEHASYIFTWYSLSAATLWMWYSRYIKR